MITNRVPRRLAACAMGAAGVMALGGCMVPKPAGDGLVRYRDEVFTQVTATTDLQYGSAPARATGAPVALRLDLYRPTGDTQRLRPAFVYAHGGGFVGGDKADSSMAQSFARRGYVAVSINYRLKAGSGCSAGGGVTADCYLAATDATHDAQAAVRWLRANAAAYGIDPTRIGMAGSSAGAIMATAVGLRADDPGDSGNPGYSSAIGAFGSFSGGLPGGLFASAGDASGVFVHGTADTTVPYSFAAETAAAMLRAGVPAFLEPLEGAGHTPGSAIPQFVQQTSYLLYASLDLAHAAGQPSALGTAASRQAARWARAHPRFAPAYRRWQRLGHRRPAHRRAAAPRARHRAVMVR